MWALKQKYQCYYPNILRHESKTKKESLEIKNQVKEEKESKKKLP